MEAWDEGRKRRSVDEAKGATTWCFGSAKGGARHVNSFQSNGYDGMRHLMASGYLWRRGDLAVPLGTFPRLVSLINV